MLATAFVAATIVMAWERPLCCLDDAVFAVVAKNLASGRGYVASFGPGLDQPFAPWVGTGPTSILPAAAAIALFGPDPRVPGLAHIVLWVVLLAFVLRAATRLGARPWTLVAAFVAIQLAISARSFEHWYALLGEVPAALLVIVGAAVLAREDVARRHVFASGLAFGAATLGKLLAVLYLVGPFLWLARKLRPGPAGESLAGGRWALVFGAGLLVPHLAFETWKLSVLGVATWWANVERLGAFVGEYGTGSPAAAGWTELGHRVDLLEDRLVVSPLLFAATVALAGFAARGLSQPARRFVALLLGGVGINLVYWLFASSGRPRYAFIAAVVWGFALAFLIATARGAPRLGFAAVLAWSLALGLPRFSRQWDLLAMARRPETSQSAAARAVAAAIRATTHGDPIVARSWGHVSALEYLSDEPGQFRAQPSVDESVAWLVSDDRVSGLRDATLRALFAACPATVFRRSPYTLRRCLAAGGAIDAGERRLEARPDQNGTE